MNPYYSAPAAPIDFTVARAAPIRTEFARIEAAFDKLNGRTSFLIAGGTANALTLDMAFPPEEYEEGMVLLVKITDTNTGPATINVNDLGPVEVVTRVNDPLVAGDLIEGSVETLFYVDGRFMIREVAGAQGPEGPQGPADGPPGLSAYQVALAGGFVGTQAQWLLSLVGAAGANGNTVLNGAAAPGPLDGINGDFWIRTSNWTIYGPKALGAWPAPVSLVGPPGSGTNGTNGTNGLSAYQIAVANGYVGSEAAWLASLQGADGTGSTWNDLGGKPASLTALAALAGADHKLPLFTGVGSMALVTLSPFMRDLLAVSDGAALAGSLGAVSVVEAHGGSPGWLRLDVGDFVLSLMWGVTTIAGNGVTVVNYPDGGFSTFSIAVLSANGDTATTAQHNPGAVTSCGTTSFNVFSAADAAKPGFWIAVGV